MLRSVLLVWGKKGSFEAVRLYSIRVNKALVELGFASSRRKADQLISLGKIKINGKLAQTTSQVSGGDTIEAQNMTVTYQPSLPSNQLILLNKPKGYLSSHLSQDAPTIFELLPDKYHSYKIAGRLDKDSRGLMLISNNGQLIQQLSHPSSHKSKYYRITLDRQIKDFGFVAKQFKSGMTIDGQIYRAQAIKLIRPDIVEIILISGKNRQIRKMFKAMGYQVIDLIRTKIGDYQLGDLEEGQYQIVQIATKEPQ
ncbi:rRNA pseudouridine synthase [Candidatus Saccharibacteria bacterium]|nr:rRNA pseudouridine synthase [Candidatus Saccharibacteria bacterium]MCB9834908.1 rRNA pseudouridine synthase [Candidatus Nomurabacteria bacterium]